LTHAHEQILNVATDAKGRKLMITPLIAPAADKVADAVVARNGWAKRTFNTEGFAAGYIGFFAANNCILMQQFGDEAADKAALSIVQRLYPNRTVLQIAADGLANGGGTIHCSTQQQPKV
jgi:agmatine deiminase